MCFGGDRLSFIISNEHRQNAPCPIACHISLAKKMNDWKKTEIGLIPLNWNLKKLGDLLSKDRGISVGVMYPGENCSYGIPLIKVGDLTTNNINPNPEFYITPEKHYEYRRTELEGGELLLTLVGALGHCGVVPESMRGWNAARAIAVIRLEDKKLASFVRLCLLSPHIQHLIKVWANTSVQATINLKEVKELPIIFPPIEEQKSIAAVLSCLDRKIENLRKQNETLEAIAQTLFKRWFIDFEFPYDFAQGKPSPDGQPYKSSGGAMQPSELGEIPEGWRVGILDNVLVVLRCNGEESYD